MKKNSAKRIERRNEEIANRTLYIVSRMFTRPDGGFSVQINVNLTDGFWKLQQFFIEFSLFSLLRRFLLISNAFLFKQGFSCFFKNVAHELSQLFLVLPYDNNLCYCAARNASLITRSPFSTSDVKYLLHFLLNISFVSFSTISM